ncbi:hypothetical protein [Rhizobium sp. Root1220]|uniref:lipopolysaccharide biosynthesis protein n=1 Tax=Rhizobium sp. Root1220 TaxID=1736432 RepID=UPI0006FEE742|nr:hypothetical protein [Rhizobium sp. Root1220]KQV83779.1 hypothetical protein ASC90_19130 [Rhizobium sp. Root1220]
MRIASGDLPQRDGLAPLSLRGPGNAALLIVSFAVGQGSIFLAQTWLVSRGMLELMAHFGGCFSFAILALMIVDCGSVTTVARRISLADLPDRKAEIGRCYWSTSITRLLLAAVVALFALPYAMLTQDVFASVYIPSAVPALVIWSFNGSGILDGLKLSGVSGLTAMVAYLCSAVALVLTGGVSAEQAGLVLGAALSAGYALAVATQLAVLYFLGHFPKRTEMIWSHVLELAREGSAVLLANIPGQLSFRFQIVVCSLFFGEAVTAIFLYGRQVAAAGSQVLEFVRRAHFPLLVDRVSRSDNPVSSAFRVQLLATWLAVVISLAMLANGIFLQQKSHGPIAAAAGVVALFSVGVLTGALSQTLAQAAQALGRYGTVARAANAAMLACSASSAAFGWWFGLAGLAVSEVLSHGVAAIFLGLFVFASGPRRRSLQAMS